MDFSNMSADSSFEHSGQVAPAGQLVGSQSTEALKPLPGWARKHQKGAPAPGSEEKHVPKSRSTSDLNRNNLPEHWKTKEQRSAEVRERQHRQLPRRLKTRPFPRRRESDQLAEPVSPNTRRAELEAKERQDKKERCVATPCLCARTPRTRMH